MSYEGFTQVICEQGHEYHVDANASYYGFDTREEREKVYQCPVCGSKPSWSCEVDETNGYDENNPWTYPRATVVVSRYDKPQMDHRGNHYMTLDIRVAPADITQWHKW